MSGVSGIAPVLLVSAEPPECWKLNQALAKLRRCTGLILGREARGLRHCAYSPGKDLRTNPESQVCPLCLDSKAEVSIELTGELSIGESTGRLLAPHTHGADLVLFFSFFLGSTGVAPRPLH